MSMETSDAAERILTLERKIFRLRKNLDDMVSWRMPAAEQQLAMLWTGTQRLCTTTFTGQVRSPVTETAIPSTFLWIGNNTGTTIYGTGTSDGSGNFTAGAAIPNDVGTVYIANQGPGVRFAKSGVTAHTFSRCGTTSIPPQYAEPDTGYNFPDEWVYPLADTLNLTDSYYGARTLDFAFVATWQRSAVVTAPAFGGCPSNTTNMTWVFGTNGSGQMVLTIRYTFASSPAFCPQLTINVSTTVLPNSDRTITTAPGVIAKLDATWTIPAGSFLSNHLYGGASATIRVYEP